MAGANRMTWVILFIYSCHLIYWLESFYLLTLVMSFIDSSHFIYWLKSFYLWTSVISFIDSSHSIYWLVSSYLLARVILFIESSHFIFGVPLYGFAMDHRRPTTRSILAPEGNFFVIQSPVCERYLDVLLGKNRVCREVQYHHYGPVNISTTNAAIEDRTNGGDSQRCNLPSANGIKKLNWFCIAGCEMIVIGWGGVLATRCCGRVGILPPRRFCEYFNQCSNRESDKRRWFAEV